MNSGQKIFLTALLQRGTDGDNKIIGPLGRQMIGFLLPPHVDLERQHKGEKYCASLADSLIEQIRAKQEVKQEEKQGEVKEKLDKRQNILPIAAGPANVFSKLEEEKRHVVFKNWNIIAANKESEKNPMFCSDYRKLITYYLPIKELTEDKENKQADNYGIAKVRQYLSSALADPTIDQNDPLDHVLRIKFAIASGNHDEAMGLITKSSLNLNLSGADLLSDSYEFFHLDLFNSCLENTTINSSFYISSDRGYILRPKRIKGANLKGAKIPNMYFFTCPVIGQADIEKLAETQGGLDIRYGWQENTLLHYSADDSRFQDKGHHNTLVLLQNGASTRIVDSQGKLPCFHAMKVRAFEGPFSESYIISGKLKTYVSLLASLSNDELNEQEELFRHRRKDMIYTVISSFLMIVIGIVGAVNFFHMLSVSPLSFTGFQKFLNGLGFFLFAGGMMSMASYVSMPQKLSSILFDYAEVQQAIALQRLANQNPKYKIYLLLKKKYQLNEDKIPDNCLTFAEKSLFDSLTKKQLLEQQDLNNQFAEQGKSNGKSLIVKGLGFAALALLSIFAPFTIPAAAPFTLGYLYSMLGIATFAAMVYPAAGLSFSAVSKGIASIDNANQAKAFINQVIATELSKRPDDIKAEPAPAPVKTLTHQTTPAPIPQPTPPSLVVARDDEPTMTDSMRKRR